MADGPEDRKEPTREAGTKRARAPRRTKAPKAEKAAKPKAATEVPSLKSGQVHVYDLEGKPVRVVDLPSVFLSDVRLDLIRRAVTAFQANRRQAYGPSPTAGTRHSVRWAGKGHGVSRVPRIRGTMTGAQAPGTVGGRRAHPPRPDRVWAKKVNDKERRLARNAAVAALKEPGLVLQRGHRFQEGVSLPVVVEDALESLGAREGATREAVQVLHRIGVFDDVQRAKDGRQIRAGRGKMRGRRYRQPRSLLVVVKEPDKVRRSLGNLPGVDVVSPVNLNAEILAPGGDAGRLAVFSEGALEVLRSWAP
nr:50S ribosomal protein L4P [uncultured archaeon]